MPPASKRRKSEKYYQDKRARTARNKAAAEMKSSLSRGPEITEHDLLSFQFSHFGDESRPVNWFVDAETALNFKPEVEEDDGLGYYEDGVKRTLTDEQIAFFRQSELLRLEQQSKLRHDDTTASAVKGTTSPDPDTLSPLAAKTPSGSDPTIPETTELKPRQASVAQQPPPSHQKDADRKSVPHQDAGRKDSAWKERRSRSEIPYEQRNKRSWEQYIESTDEIQGALTHRRVARELDNQVAEEYEMDY